MRKETNTMPDQREVVHRPLTLSSPMMNGDDVRVLKRNLNRSVVHWKLDHRKLDDHGYATKGMFKSAALIAFCIGLSNKTIKDIESGIISEHAQKLLRHVGLPTDRRDKSHRRRSKLRRKRVRKLRATKASRIRSTMNAAGKHVGETENPPGSNTGRNISKWQVFFLGWAGWFWCGAFTGYFTKVVGKVSTITNDIVYTPSTLENARAGREGFVCLVSGGQARMGDHALFNFGSSDPVQHTGFVLRHTVQGGVPGLVCREGNTSSGSAGSQDNGGGVFDRFRPYSDVVGCARPDWK